MTTLSVDQATTITLEAVASVAPEVEDEIQSIDPTDDLWEALGLDSMDHLNVMTELARRTGVEVAERDYGRLRSLRSLAEHLAATAV